LQVSSLGRLDNVTGLKVNNTALHWTCWSLSVRKLSYHCTA